MVQDNSIQFLELSRISKLPLITSTADFTFNKTKYFMISLFYAEAKRAERKSDKRPERAHYPER